jgi:imidazolonepropionase-like amidohydrolase
MSRILIRNAQVFDATGQPPYPADVLVEGNRIRAVATDRGALDATGAEVIDGAGMTLMPGMVEGHSHPTFTGVAMPAELGEIPPEEHLILSIKNTRLMLDHGFTSLFEAASAKLRLGVVIRNAIRAGDFIGPRMRAASPEITVTAGLGDERRVHMYRESFALIADGPDEIRKAARLCMREGVDNLKINVSGDDFVTNAPRACTPMSRARSRRRRGRARVRPHAGGPFPQRREREALRRGGRGLHLPLRPGDEEALTCWSGTRTGTMSGQPSACSTT